MSSEISLQKYHGIVCGKCGAEGVRLYRSYGTFLRPETHRCNACLPTDAGWYVPLIIDAEQNVWGFTSCPDNDIQDWKDLPEKDPNGRTWKGGEEHIA